MLTDYEMLMNDIAKAARHGLVENIVLRKTQHKLHAELKLFPKKKRCVNDLVDYLNTRYGNIGSFELYLPADATQAKWFIRYECEID